MESVAQKLVARLLLVAAPVAFALVVTTTARAVVDAHIFSWGLHPPVVSTDDGGVQWTNSTLETQRLTSDDGLFDSGPIPPGGGYSLRLLVPGEHQYTASPAGFTGSLFVPAPSAPAIEGPPDAPVAEHIPDVPFPAGPESDRAPDPDLGVRASMSRIVVLFAEEATVADANAALDDAEVSIVGGLPGFRMILVEAQPPTSGHTNEERFQRRDAAVASLRADAGIAAAALDLDMELTSVPKASQPFTDSSGNAAGWVWGDTGPNLENWSGDNWYLEADRAPQAWNLRQAIKATNPDVDVAVVDQPADTSHPDLTPWVTATPLCNSNGLCTDLAPQPHGTHVAGTIGGGHDNGVGTNGIDPFARVRSVGFLYAGSLAGYASTVNIFYLILSQTGSGPFSKLRAINFSAKVGPPTLAAIRNRHTKAGVVVADCGPGANDDGPGSNGDCSMANDDAWLTQLANHGAVARHIAEVASPLNVMIVQAAGNDSDDFCMPLTDTPPNCTLAPIAADQAGEFSWASRHWQSPHPNPIVAVEALDQTLGRAVFSNLFGDISAPGTGVLNATVGGGYISLPGTSMATPQVTGAISYLLAYDPTLTIDGVKNALFGWAAGDTTSFGSSPRLDLFASLMSLQGAAKDLVDVNDRSADGNRRMRLFSHGVKTQVAALPIQPDDHIDMKDFRALRDAWLETCLYGTNLKASPCPAAGDIELDGPDDHEKKDINGDGCAAALFGLNLACPTEEPVFSRFDFNGDGYVDRSAMSNMPFDTAGAAVGFPGVALTDLQVLQGQWDGDLERTEGYAANRLDDLMLSGDLEIHADDLFDAGAVDVEVKMESSNGQALPTRHIRASLQREKSFIVATVPASGGTTVELEASAKVAGETIKASPIKVELKAGEDKRIDLCKGLTVTASPAHLAADGKQKSSIVAELHECSDVSVAGRSIEWAVDNAAGGSLTLTEAATNADGKAKATFTVGTVPGTYKVKATVTLDHDVKESAEATIKVGPPITIKYVWQQHIVDWTQTGTTRWSDAPAGMPDCTTPGVVEYCIDEFTLWLESEENGGVKRSGSVAGGGSEFKVTDEVSNGTLKSAKSWKLTLTDGTTHNGEAVSTYGPSAQEPYTDRPLKNVSATFAEDGVRVAGMQEVGDLPYQYFSSAARSGTGPEPRETHSMVANLLLVPQPEGQHVRFAAKPDEAILFSRDAATNSYLPFQSCGKLEMDLKKEHGYYVENPSIPGLPASVLGRTPIYTPGARPMPVGPGHLEVRYAFGAVVQIGSNVVAPTLPDCTVNHPPTGKLEAPESTLEGRPTKFVDRSTDIENDIESWHWDFGDGEPPSKEQSPYHTFPDNGTYTVTLTVKDSEGATDSTSKQITVENQDPLAFVDDANAEQGTPLVFALGMSDAGKVDKQNLEWTVTSTNPVWQTVQNTEAAFIGTYSVIGLPAGIYPITLTVKDKDNGATTAVATLEVTDAPTPPCDPVTGANCPPPLPPPSTIVCGPTPPQLDGEESEFFDLVNAYRIQNGVPPLLGVSPTLQPAATEHATDMAVNNFMAHIGSDGRDPVQRAQDAGYPASASLAENIASGTETAFQALFAWQTSTTGHNETMLNPAWKTIGIAREQGNGTWRWATTYGSELDCLPPAPPSPESTSTALKLTASASSAATDETGPSSSAPVQSVTTDPLDAAETGPGVRTLRRTETVEEDAPAPGSTQAPNTLMRSRTAAAEEPAHGPGAAFTLSRVTPLRRQLVTLTNRSRDAHGVPVSSTVDFGDGTPTVPLGPDESTAHGFANAGVVGIVLTANDAEGRSTTVRRDITVSLPPVPRLSYTGSREGVAGQALAVAARLVDATTDDPIVGAPVTFTLGTATTTATTDAAGVAGTTLDVAGLAAGNYALAFSFAGNDDYAPRSGTEAVKLINNAPPVAHPGGPYVLGSGTTLLLDGGRSSDPDAGDSVASWAWDLNGDGATDLTGRTPRPLQWSELQTLLCTTACAPNQDYPVSLKVTDTRGVSSSAGTFVRFASDFALFLGNETKTIVPGQSNHFAVTVVASSDFHTPVALSAVDLPAGVTATFLPSAVTPPGISVLRLTAAAGAASGAFPVRVRGTAGGITHEVSDEVVVAFGLVPVCFGTAEGTVVDATGAPVAGVQVMNNRTFVPEMTDANGRFTIRSLPLGVNNAPSTVQVTASKADYWNATVTGSTACGATTRFALSIVSKLKGRVSGVIREGTIGTGGQVVPTTDPVPGALVVFDNVQIFPADPSGAYVADVELSQNNVPRGYSATASAPGYWHEAKPVLAEAAVPKSVNFVLVKQCKATLVGGTVRYQDGTPVANHLVGFDPNGSGFTVVSTRTDAEGNFTLNREELLGHNNTTRTMFIRVFADASDPPGTQTGVFAWQLTACGEQSTRSFTFIRPTARRGSFEGIVRDEETGAPLAGALLTGHKDQNLPGSTGSNFAATDADGRFRVDDILIGYDSSTTATRAVTVSKTGYYSVTVNATLRADQTTTADYVLLRKRVGSAQGHVRDAATQVPIAGATLRPIFGLLCADFFCATSAPDGAYSSPVTLGSRNAPRSATVLVSADGYWDRQKVIAVTADATTTTDFDLVRKCTPARIVGTVVNALTQEPILGAEVRSGAARAFTDAGGRFELAGVQPGVDNAPMQASVTASAPGFISQSKTVTIFCGATIVVEFGTPQTALGVVVGTLTDADTGQPIANAFIGTEFGGSATTDATGSYRIPGVPLGPQNADREWSITAAPAGYRPQTRAVTAKANADVRADFSFSKVANHRPVAEARSFTVDENGQVALTFAGIDADGDELTFGIATHPQHGRLAGAPPHTTYIPDQDYHGADSFTYTAFDGQELSAPATVTIDVRHVNRPPVARPDGFTVTAGAPATLDVLANDSDPDGDTPSLTNVTAGADTHGTVAIAANKVVYTPVEGFLGFACFSYTIGDGNGGAATALACAEVVLGPPPPAPTCDATSFSVLEDGSLADAVACTGGSGPLVYSVLHAPAHGTVTLAASGSFTYAPEPDYFGPDSFTFTAGDGTHISSAATASIAVTGVNDAPVARGDSVAVDEDDPAAVDVRSNDSPGPVNESSQQLTLDRASAPAHGTALVAALGPDAGKVVYTPAPGYAGPDSFSYTVCDDGSPPLCSTATVQVSVTAADDAPVAQDGTATLAEDSSADVSLSAVDPDGGSMEYTIVDGPAHGALSGTAPHLSYRPVADYHGADSFTFRVRSGALNSNLATVAITVTPVNDAPTASLVAPASLGEGTSGELTAAAADVDGDRLEYRWTADGGILTSDAARAHLSHPDGPALVVVTLVVSDGSLDVRVTKTIPIANVAPIVEAGADASVRAGETFTLAASFADLGADTHVVSVDWGDGSPPSSTLSAAHVYAIAGSYSARVRVSDDDGGTGVDELLVTVTAAAADASAPTCTIVEQGKTATGHGFVRFRVEDVGLGLDRHVIVFRHNVTVAVDPYTRGAHGPINVTATAVDASRSLGVQVDFYDIAGNKAVCDPIVLVVARVDSQPEDEVFTDVPQAESKVTILNGDPGMKKVELLVNGVKFKEAALAAGEVRRFDVAAEMRPGSTNTIVVRTRGQKGATAVIVIADI